MKGIGIASFEITSESLRQVQAYFAPKYTVQ